MSECYPISDKTKIGGLYINFAVAWGTVFYGMAVQVCCAWGALGKLRCWPPPSPNAFPLLVDVGLLLTCERWVCEVFSITMVVVNLCRRHMGFLIFFYGQDSQQHQASVPRLCVRVPEWMNWAVVWGTKEDQRRQFALKSQLLNKTRKIILPLSHL